MSAHYSTVVGAVILLAGSVRGSKLDSPHLNTFYSLISMVNTELVASCKTHVSFIKLFWVQFIADFHSILLVNGPLGFLLTFVVCKQNRWRVYAIIFKQWVILKLLLVLWGAIIYRSIGSLEKPKTIKINCKLLIRKQGSSLSVHFLFFTPILIVSIFYYKSW